jgi:DNA-directed RNA polymerase subunit RPC12/RpoP
MPVGVTVSCANCRQAWLVPGLRRGDTYVCKGCGHRLLYEGRAERPSPQAPARGDRARARVRPPARCES